MPFLSLLRSVFLTGVRVTFFTGKCSALHPRLWLPALPYLLLPWSRASPYHLSPFRRPAFPDLPPSMAVVKGSHHKIDWISFEQLCWPEGRRVWTPGVTKRAHQSLKYSGLPALPPSGRTMCVQKCSRHFCRQNDAHIAVGSDAFQTRPCLKRHKPHGSSKCRNCRSKFLPLAFPPDLNTILPRA
jgi:hypothetical protein